MNDEIVKFSEQPIVSDMAKQYGVEAMMLLHTIQAQLPKETSLASLMTCVSTASALRLNPFLKEIWFMAPRGKGPPQPIVSVDGFIKIARRDPDFSGWKFIPEFDESGKMVSMTGIMYHKNRDHPTEITEYMDECAQAGPVWKSHPKRMMRNRTISQLVRVGLGISGIMDPDEYQQWQSSEAAGEPIPLQDVETISPRDGGELPRSTLGRPASGAFKDLGGDDKYHELNAQIQATETVEDLQKCFDGFERNNVPWSEFPLGWARTLQADYQHRLTELREKPEDEDISLFKLIPIAPDREALAQIYRENFDTSPWGKFPPDEQEDLQSIYDARMDELEAMQI